MHISYCSSLNQAASLLAFLCILQFCICQKQPVHLSGCLASCQSLTLGLRQFDRSASLSIYISASLFPVCKPGENEAKLDEDVWWSRENP